MRFLLAIIFLTSFLLVGCGSLPYKDEAIQFDKKYANEFDELHDNYKKRFMISLGQRITSEVINTDEPKQVTTKFIADAQALNKKINNEVKNEGVKKLKEILIEKIQTQISLETFRYPETNDDEEFEMAILEDFFLGQRAYELDIMYKSELKKLTTGEKYATINLESFKRIKLGDEYEDVIKKLHSIGEPLDRKITPSIEQLYYTRHLGICKNLNEKYQWKDGNAKILATFRNNQLVEIKQSNLK